MKASVEVLLHGSPIRDGSWPVVVVAMHGPQGWQWLNPESMKFVLELLVLPCGTLNVTLAMTMEEQTHQLLQIIAMFAEKVAQCIHILADGCPTR